MALFWLFLVIWICLIFLVVTIILCVTNYDRIIVYILRQNQIFAFPTAIEIANSILNNKSWTFDQFYARDGDITITISGGVDSIDVLTTAGKWRPNKIERRIIWNAVTSRQKQEIAKVLNVALKSNNG